MNSRWFYDILLTAFVLLLLMVVPTEAKQCADKSADAAAYVACAGRFAGTSCSALILNCFPCNFLIGFAMYRVSSIITEGAPGVKSGPVCGGILEKCLVRYPTGRLAQSGRTAINKMITYLR